QVQELALQALVVLSEQLLGEVRGQGRDRAVDAEERRRHLVPRQPVAPLGLGHLRDVRRREREVEDGTEPDDLLLDGTLVADGDRSGDAVLEQTDGLEERKAEPFLEEGRLYRMIRSPVLVGHAWISPYLTPFTVRRTKALSDTYCEKNSSRIAPNKYASPSLP